MTASKIIHRTTLTIAASFIIAGLTGCKGPIYTSPPPPKPPQNVAQSNASLTPRSSLLDVGARVPVFRLQDQKGFEVSSAELTSGKGSIIIFMLPGGSPGNRPVYTWITKYQSFLANQGIESLIVTPHKPEENNVLARRNDVRLAVLSDPSYWVSRSFGVIPEGAQRPDAPVMYYLGNNGRIQYSGTNLKTGADILVLSESMPGQERDSIF